MKKIQICFALAIIFLVNCFLPIQSNKQDKNTLQSVITSAFSSKTANAASANWSDVAYASASNAQKLDIYLPTTGTAPFPVIVSIHGGAFMMGSKSDGQEAPMLQALARGYAVASINYRLSTEAKFPAQIYDVKAAIRFLRANASTYQLNPDKIATWGGSAGGNLSALAGTSGDVAELEDLSMGNSQYSSKVQATVDWYGPIYFSTMDSEFSALGVTPVTGATNSTSSPETKYLGYTVGTTAAEPYVIKASPQTYIDANDPPFFIQHGTADRNIPITQSVNFSNKLISALGSSKLTYMPLSGASHGGSQFTASSNVSLVIDFLDKYLMDSFTISEFSCGNIENGKINISAKVKNSTTANNSTLKIIYVSYDSDNKMTGLSVDSESIENQVSKTISKQLDFTGTASKVKMFVLDDLVNIKPISNVAEFNY